MEPSCSPTPVLMRDDSLQCWKVIGRGGFGQIHRAKHVKWGMDVAIKLLHYNDGSGSSLLREADLMRQGGNPHVLRILGVYQGCPPGSCPSVQQGLVMEFMERGSMASLQEALGGHPPWPLAFRLAHQIALGMNFLHHLSPPLLHLDLKPSNVLLDDSLSAKLTDFGLARLARTVSLATKDGDEEEGGTINYMPPEAFDVNYKPTCASDVYSYGILLWSIVSGVEPYPNVYTSLVRFRIPLGDRPSLEGLDTGQAEGLEKLTELMETCWGKDPHQRPSFKSCLQVTERLFGLHKRGVNDAVHQVLKKLDSDSEEGSMNSSFDALHIDPISPQPLRDTTHNMHSSHCVQEMTDDSKPKDKEHGSPPPLRTQTAEAISASFSHKPTPVSPFPKQRPIGTQRQFSNPVLNTRNPGGVSIYMSDVIGAQIGHGNTMNISMPAKKRRHRNPTAPPRVNIPTSQSENHHK